MIRWGVVATIKAETRNILEFAAHHAELGAHRIYIYLDEPDPETIAALKPHPKVRVTACDGAYWKRLGARPAKHQSRQTINATHAYDRRAEVEWLAHIDADEFLWPVTSVATALAALPDDAMTARVRAVEALAPDTPDRFAPATAFKATPLERTARTDATRRLYPDYADYIDDGFLSHVAGKLFVRLGLAGAEFRIHNFRCDLGENPGQVELDELRLLHMHAEGWDDWLAKFDYRHAKGAYRADLGRKGPTGLNLHDFFAALLGAEGEQGLRRFYDTLFLATPDHCAALERLDLLRVHDLDLEAKRKRHFPTYG